MSGPRQGSLIPDEALEPRGDGATLYRDTESWLPPGDCDLGDDNFMRDDEGHDGDDSDC